MDSVRKELQDLGSKMCCSMHVELAKIGHCGDSMGDIIKRLLDHYNKEKSKGLR